jgi:hypothetical protein
MRPYDWSTSAASIPMRSNQWKPTFTPSRSFGGSLRTKALIHGFFTLDQLNVDVLRDQRVGALMKRIHHVPAGESETIVVHLRDGRRERIDVRPVSRLSDRAGILEKFDQCATPVIGRSATEILRRQIGMLEDLPDLSRLMAAAGAAVHAAA